MSNKHKTSISFTETFRKLRPYLLVFFISLLTLEGFIFFFASGFGHLVPGSLHPVLNIFNAFAGVSFCFYLKHTKSFENLSEDFCILLSVSYGLCAYGLLQETNLRYLAIFVLFPLLFYSYEKMMNEDSFLFYVLLLTLCFFTDYMLTAIILITLTVHVLLFAEGGIGVHLRAFFKFAGLSCIPLLISGIITFPQYAEYFSYIGSNPYTGFSTTLPVMTALSRFLLGSVSSAAFFSDLKLDLYFGLFFFLMAVFYFLLPAIPKKDKIKNILFVFFLFAATEFSPVYFLVNIFRIYSGGSIYYGFLLIFFLLLLSSKSLTFIDTFRFPELLFLILFSMLYLTLCLLCAGHNYHTIAKQSNIFFSAVYLLLLLALSFRNKITFPIKPLLICLIFLELFCNIFIVANQNFIPTPLDLSDHYPDLSIWQEYPSLNATTNLSAVNETDTDYIPQTQKTFLATSDIEETSLEDSEANQYVAGDLINILNALPGEEILSQADKDAAGITNLTDYFTLTNEIIHKMGATEDLFIPADFELDFAESDYYRVLDLNNHIYSFSYTRDEDKPVQFYDMKATISTSGEGTLIILDTLNMQLYSFDITDKTYTKKVTFYFPLSSEYTINNRFNGYWLNKELYSVLPSLTDNYENSLSVQDKSFQMLSHYIGIAATCVGVFIMLLLFFNKDKDKIFVFLRICGEKTENNRIFEKIGTFFQENKIYCLSFLIPFSFFIFSLIINSCAPFGANSIFDEDGLQLTYPANLDTFYNLKEGHVLYSFLGGYGYSLYATNPLAITRLFTTLFSAGQIAALLTIEEGFFLGLSGLSLAFYLTHRLNGSKADKYDVKIIIPVMIYTLNNYMLCMHGFTSWYQIFPALPLLLLAMDYLIFRKKCILYIITLAYCIYVNLYLALYICIFLIIYFFVYRFDSIKDFLLKGFRFASCSILAALNSFFIISNTLLATRDSAYQIDDSVFPSLGFHGSFFSQWKQHMIFSKVGAVNWNESHVNLYAGIGTLLLICIFCLSRKIKFSDKLRVLLPIGILYVSFNGRILSYIWNGFHYQSGVPNRYAFLLMLMIALLSYDILKYLKELSLSYYILITGVVILFFIGCQFIGVGNSIFAFISTLIVLIIYFTFFLLHYLTRRNKQAFSNAFTIILTLELFCNMLFAFSQYNLPGIYMFGDIEAIHDAFVELDEDALPLARTLYASAPYKNGGAIYQTETNEIFNSFVSMHQSNLNMRYGMTGGINYLTTSNASTPLGTSLSGAQFLYYPYMTYNVCMDLEEYQYLGTIGGNYIFKNPYVLPLGIYAPYEAAQLDDYSSFIPYYMNDLASFYLPEGRDLHSYLLVSYDEDGIGENIFYYTDKNGNHLTFEDVQNILDATGREGSAIDPMNNLFINLSITPETSGSIYLYSIEFISLGYSKEGETLNFRVPFPASSFPASNDIYNIIIFNNDNMPEFYKNANKYTLENISYNGHTLTGTTNYIKDGYTMLSIPYDQGWKAYIDGEAVDIEDPYQSMMFIKTPAGHHELKLVFIPYGMVLSLSVTGGSIIFTCLLFFIISRLKRKHPSNITKYEGK